jgi:hypothetical protein
MHRWQLAFQGQTYKCVQYLGENEREEIEGSKKEEKVTRESRG